MDISSQRQSYSKRIFKIRIAVDITIWITASIVAFYIFLHGRPYERGFFCGERSLSYPTVQETISTPVLVVVGLLVSIALVISIEVLNSLDFKCSQRCRSTRDFLFCVRSYIVFLIGFLAQELFVDAIKNKTGVLRPNFFDVCKPQFNTSYCPGYIIEYTCSETNDKDIRSSRQSFPSGHSSVAMYIAVYFCIYIENRLQIKYTRLLKIFLQAGFMLAALFCGLGRLRENKHHSSDVIAGFILGFAAAVFVHATLWRKFVNKRDVKKMNGDENHECRDCYCSREQSSVLDPETPISLLQIGCFKTLANGKESSSTNLITLHNNNNQSALETSEIV